MYLCYTTKVILHQPIGKQKCMKTPIFRVKSPVHLWNGLQTDRKIEDNRLFVAQCLNRIKLRGAAGRHITCGQTGNNTNGDSEENPQPGQNKFCVQY